MVSLLFLVIIIDTNTGMFGNDSREPRYNTACIKISTARKRLF